MLRAVLALLLLAAPAAGFSQGAIRESDEWILDRKGTSTLRFLSAEFGFPSPLLQSDVVVLVSAGAAASDVWVVGPVGADPRRYAQVLNQWQASQGRQDVVEWSSEKTGAVARLAWGDGKFGQTSARQALPLGDLATRLRTVSPSVRMAVRLPDCVTDDLDLPSVARHKARHYDLTGKASHSILHVGATVPPWSLGGFALLLLTTAALCTLGYRRAIFRSRRESEPIEARRKEWNRTAVRSVMVPLFIGFAPLYALTAFGSLRPCVDLWFGSFESVNLTILLLVVPIMVLSAFTSSVVRKERELFGEAVPIEGQLSPAEVSPELRASLDRSARIQKTVWKVTTSLAFVALALIPAKSRLAELPVFTLVFVPMVVATLLIHFALGPRLEKPVEDPELSLHVKALAASMGLSVGTVWITQDAITRTSPNVSITASGDVRISRRTLLILKPEELRFYIAHQLAHRQLGHVRTELAARVVPPVVLLGLLLAMQDVLLRLRGSLPIALGVCLGAAVVLVLVSPRWIMTRIWSRLDREADQKALEVTGDLAAAESCLSKLVERPDTPQAERIAQRIESVREHAPIIA